MYNCVCVVEKEEPSKSCMLLGRENRKFVSRFIKMADGKGVDVDPDHTSLAASSSSGSVLRVGGAEAVDVV